MKIITYKLKEIDRIAKELCRSIYPGDVVTFSGELATGKTTLIKELVRSFGYGGNVSSPTFVIERRYPIKQSPFTEIIHLDFYRLDSAAIEHFDWSEYLENFNAITFIEWPERIGRELPKSTKSIIITFVNDQTRKLSLSNNFSS